MFTLGCIFGLMHIREVSVNKVQYFKYKKEDYVKTQVGSKTNVLDLIKRVEVERKKEKRKTFIVAATALTTLAISSIIIIQ